MSDVNWVQFQKATSSPYLKLFHVWCKLGTIPKGDLIPLFETSWKCEDLKDQTKIGNTKSWWIYQKRRSSWVPKTRSVFIASGLDVSPQSSISKSKNNTCRAIKRFVFSRRATTTQYMHASSNNLQRPRSLKAYIHPRHRIVSIVRSFTPKAHSTVSPPQTTTWIVAHMTSQRNSSTKMLLAWGRRERSGLAKCTCRRAWCPWEQTDSTSVWDSWGESSVLKWSS